MTYTELKELAKKVNAGYVPTDEEIQATRETLEPTLAAICQAVEKLAAALAEVLPVWAQALSEMVPLLLKADRELDRCPNHRVAHLARHARKYRTRKKNLHRAFKLLEKEEVIP